MNKYLPYLIFLFFSFLGCQKDSRNTFNEIDIDISQAHKFDNKLPVSSINYIPLQTVNAPLLGKIRLIKKYGDKFYILTRDGDKCSLNVFNGDGSYFGKLEFPGDGPGEFNAVNDFIVDLNNGSIELYDMEKLSIIRYGLDLNYINEIQLDNLYKEFVKFEEDEYVFYSGNKDANLKNIIYVSKGKEEDKKMSFPLMGFSVEGPHFSEEYGKKNYLVHDSFNDTIYSFTSHSKSFMPKFHLDFRGQFVDEKWISDFGNAEMMERMNLMNRSGKIYSFKYISYFDEILLTAFYNFTEKRFYFNFYNDNLNRNYLFFVERALGEPNFYDLGPIPRFLACQDDKKLIFYVDAPDIAEHIGSIEQEELSEYPQQLTKRFEDLKQKVGSVGINDNPVLMSISLDYKEMFSE